MSFFDAHKFSGESIEHFAHIINCMHTGIWEYNTGTKKTTWSAGFYTMLGYAPGEIECSYHNFFENILYYGDRKTFLRSTDAAAKESLVPAHIRLLIKSDGYQWFQSTSQRLDTAEGTVIYGVLDNINEYKIAQFKAQQNDELNAETGRMAKLGSWEIDAATKSLHLSTDIYEIFELTGEKQLSVAEAISYFEPAYRQIITDAVDNALRFSKPYDLELQLRTAKNNVIWVRSKGIAVIDDLGRCKTVRGIFQDIDRIKKRGLNMQSSINRLDDQNKRLQNFAYIVSHNLRSHAGNLKFMVSLYEDAGQSNDREEIFAHIKTISDSLNLTIGHLDEIVKIQTEVTRERKVVNLPAIYENVTAALQANITATGAQIITDFEACSEIPYIPAYMESIMQNLLTNAIKYKHPDRNPIIDCKTVKDNEGIYLIVSDNGVGIDLERYGEDVFGLYKTFHLNKDAKGIGLFITRNQVEALGGNIRVESEVNVGTKFTVKLV
ncbi:ATP-binding protein [Mucilaginibacter sp.]|uniref:sensor histidine kinase n=1 Tax=Mucilaginibacter sp. TaxID=1882438 RepID=UPI0035BC2E79